MNKSKTPKWPLSKAIAAAIEALKMANENQKELEARRTFSRLLPAERSKGRRVPGTPIPRSKGQEEVKNL